MSKHSVLKMARGLSTVFRPVEVTDIDDTHHAFIVRYSGDYITHAHDKDEFVYILEGSLVVEMEGSEVEVRQGEAILIPAGTRHRPRCRNFALGLVVETKGLQKQMDPQV
ncbi:cupin domain-containing protein [bacterium]|nr:cupin domain-containing protein [bacterium]